MSSVNASQVSAPARTARPGLDRGDHRWPLWATYRACLRRPRPFFGWGLVIEFDIGRFDPEAASYGLAPEFEPLVPEEIVRVVTSADRPFAVRRKERARRGGQTSTRTTVVRADEGGGDVRHLPVFVATGDGPPAAHFVNPFKRPPADMPELEYRLAIELERAVAARAVASGGTYPRLYGGQAAAWLAESAVDSPPRLYSFSADRFGPTAEFPELADPWLARYAARRWDRAGCPVLAPVAGLVAEAGDRLVIERDEGGTLAVTPPGHWQATDGLAGAVVKAGQVVGRCTRVRGSALVQSFAAATRVWSQGGWWVPAELDPAADRRAWAIGGVDRGIEAVRANDRPFAFGLVGGVVDEQNGRWLVAITGRG